MTPYERGRAAAEAVLDAAIVDLDDTATRLRQQPDDGRGELARTEALARQLRTGARHGQEIAA